MKNYPVLNKTPRNEECGSGGIAPLILNLGPRWRWMVSLTPHTLYTREER